MNNLIQNQRDAKQAYLDNQQAPMIARYQIADQTERAAIIRQIDSFLPLQKLLSDLIVIVRSNNPTLYLQQLL